MRDLASRILVRGTVRLALRRTRYAIEITRHHQSNPRQQERLDQSSGEGDPNRVWRAFSLGPFELACDKSIPVMSCGALAWSRQELARDEEHGGTGNRP